MEKISLKEYARIHKMSLFSVVKMVKSGKLKSETVREEGKERVYVFTNTHEAENIVGAEGEGEGQRREMSLSSRVSELEAEVARLRTVLKRMQKKFG